VVDTSPEEEVAPERLIPMTDIHVTLRIFGFVGGDKHRHENLKKT